jgi:hypothetical protein
MENVLGWAGRGRVTPGEKGPAETSHYEPAIAEKPAVRPSIGMLAMTIPWL